MTLAFRMDLNTAIKFYDMCNELHLESEDERLDLLSEMIAARFDISVFKTNRTPDQIATDHSKHGNVLYLKLNKEGKNEKENS